MSSPIDLDLSGVSRPRPPATMSRSGASSPRTTPRWWVCVVVARDQGIAEEAVQAAWSIAWRRLGSVRDPDRLRAWLVSVAVNEARQLLRKRRRRSLVEITGDRTEPAGGVDPSTGVASLDLQRAVERLEAGDRALLALRYVAGFDASQLSSALGISPAGVPQRLKRLLDELREDLGHG